MQSKDHFPSLSDLLLDIKNSVEDRFPIPVWFVAEVISFNLHHGSGHCYLELMDKDQLSGRESRTKATIWKNNYQFIKRSFEGQTGQSIQPGMRLLLLGLVRFHEYYGFSINIEDVDATYTLGALVLKRQQILGELTALQLVDTNRLVTFPSVPQRLAIVSSGQAAGYEDFEHSLRDNPYGYKFLISLFPASMQGKQTSVSIQEALNAIKSRQSEFDVVVIIRGGGSQTDLFWFDDFELGKSIAQFPLPVLCGLGHKKDMTVVDAVAYQALITPTAVAGFLVETVNRFEIDLQTLVHDITAISSEVVSRGLEQLAVYSYAWKLGLQQFATSENENVSLLLDSIVKQIGFSLEKSILELNQWLDWAKWADPQTQFKRGFALIADEEGRAVREIPAIDSILKIKNDIFSLKTKVIDYEVGK